ncbi:MAG: spondin domain-containing protein [Gemmatimonadales bacterium]
MFRPTMLAMAALLTAGTGAAQQQAATKFTIRIENTTSAPVLKLAGGGAAPFVMAPVLWAVHDLREPVFTVGTADRRQGLETLAETGNPEPLVKALTGKRGIRAAGAMAVPVGEMAGGPLTPGKAYEFSVMARPGDRLSLAWMFGQSNDLFYGLSSYGVPLFDANGMARSGDFTRYVMLYDAGTEVNEEPGSGPNQAPRQKMANDGVSENGFVRPVNDQFQYPVIGTVMKVTVTAAGASAM